MRFLIAVVALTILSHGAHAEVYKYSCKVGARSAPLQIDDVRNELSWKGRKFKLSVLESCPKFGWRAERQGEAFDFCTATQGYAAFKENGALVQCDQR